VAYYTVEEEIQEHLGPLVESVRPSAAPEGTIWSLHKDEFSSLGLTKFSFDPPLLGRELLAVIGNLDSQIISRDYLLIDQSDFVTTYLRVGESGNPLISAGCQSELVYAYGAGKPVYVVFPGGERKLSPWVTQFSKCFTNLEDAFTYIKQHHRASGGAPAC